MMLNVLVKKGGKLLKISLNLFLWLHLLQSSWEVLSGFGMLIEY